MRYLLILLFLVGCNMTNKAKETKIKNQIEIGLLFENDGCKVWRFEDSGHYRYYADCGSTIGSQNDTKNMIPDAIPNGRPKRK